LLSIFNKRSRNLLGIDISSSSIVGNLFKKREENKSKTELLIFITPSVINELK